MKPSYTTEIVSRIAPRAAFGVEYSFKAMRGARTVHIDPRWTPYRFEAEKWANAWKPEEQSK